MAINLKQMHRHWMESSLIVGTDGQMTIPPEWAACEQLMRIRHAMVDVARSEEVLFRKPDRMRRDRRKVIPSRTGRALLVCLNADVAEICRLFPLHRFDPYFSLFVEVYRASPLWRWYRLRESAVALNSFVDDLRAGVKRAGFMKEVKNHERGAMKNAKTVKRYIEDMYHDYPKLLHVRLDLNYKTDWPLHSTSPVTAKVIKRHWAMLIRYVKKKFKGVYVGHLWTIEFGAFKGPHLHIYIHFNGQKVRQGISIAQQIGEYWQHVVTKGTGRYWNVNRNEDAFEREGRRGIGLISYLDEKRRENLVRSALYLVKADLFVRMVMPGIGKTFGHGRYKPRVKSNAGRKRKTHKLETWVEGAAKRRGGITREPLQSELPPLLSRWTSSPGADRL